MTKISLFALILALAPVAAHAQQYDLILRHGRIIDGTGSPWYYGDVAIRGDRIARIARSIPDSARRIIDVHGQVIAPGFIDIHTHSDRGILATPTADNYVRQGVTLLMQGPDGGSAVPLGPWLARLDSLPKSVNVASFIGQGSVRHAVMGDVDRKPTDAEMAKMRELVRQGMLDGAFGLSTGLFYVPGTFSTTEEVIDLERIAGRMGGIHESHMRDEAAGVVASVKETIRIGEEGGLPTQVTHHKIIGKPYWGLSVETLKLVDEARARGVDVTIDQYPYTASATGVSNALFPAWAQEGGEKAMLARLHDPATRARIKTEAIRLLQNERGGGDPKNVELANCRFDSTLAGKNLAEVAQRRGLQPTIEGAADAALWLVENGGCQGIWHAISEADLRRILQHPATMIASDGEIPRFGQGHPHPRSYGTFARVLGEYVREQHLLTLENAVHKMSGMPAARLGLQDRGLLREGMIADVAVFDPATIKDNATFQQPHQYASGVSTVIVNGVVVLENGAMTAARPGRVLYGPARINRALVP